jgi:adenylate cyclase
VTERLDRRLVAVMFTDMVGYTALMHADERLAVDKRDRYVDTLVRRHKEFGGTVVQRLGDGSMSMFPSSLDAVLAAVAMQQELRGQDVPVRIGIHVGEVVVEPDRLTGDAVNIAARIESFAVPGGVLVSDVAYVPVQNPERCRGCSAWTVQAQERRAAVRAVRRVGGGCRGAGCRRAGR